MKRLATLTASVLCLVVPSVQAADWLTDGYDTKRTNWQRDEKTLTPENVKGLKLLWKTKLDNQPVGHGALRGKPGPVYARLYEAYQRAKQSQSI